MITEQDILDRKFKKFRQTSDSDQYIAKGIRTHGDKKRITLILLERKENDFSISNYFTNPAFNREFFAIGNLQTPGMLDSLIDYTDFEIEELKNLTLSEITKFGEGSKH